MIMENSEKLWTGKVPDNWKFYKGKYIFGERSERGNAINLQLLSPTQKYGVIPQSMYDELTSMKSVKVKEDTDLSTFKTIHRGDFCISLRSFQGGFEYSEYEGVVSPAYHVLFSKMDICAGYYKYLFKEQRFIAEMNSYCQSLRDGKNISYFDFGRTLIPFPPLSEQQSIADYLDETCSKIDEIIAEAKASIDEYKELKQSVIFEAVTKGLDKNVEMKDSGVEWIGNIPSSWQLRKLKTFTVMISKGTTPKDMSNVKTTLYCVRYLKSENIKNNHLDIVPEFYITEATHNELSRSKLNGNDILFVIAGASIGKVAIMDENLLPANTNQANAFIRIKDEFMDSIEYLWMLLQSVIVKEVINRYSVQSAQPNISMENLGNIKLPYPLSKRERNNIMNYLREKIDAIDSLIAEKESLINDLEAYKKSLIYEVVTGKRRVV